METQKERLIKFIDSIGYSVREFERTIGVSNGTVRHAADNLSANLKEKVSAKFPQLNQDWLLLGNGHMTTNCAQGDGSMQNVSGSNNNIGVPSKNFAHESDWFALIAEKDKQIDRLLTIIENMQK